LPAQSLHCHFLCLFDANQTNSALIATATCISSSSLICAASYSGHTCDSHQRFGLMCSLIQRSDWFRVMVSVAVVGRPPADSCDFESFAASFRKLEA
jgi:hypothetical protein